MGTAVFFPGEKWLRGEINHSFQSSAEVKNERSCALTPAVCLHGVGRDTFTSIWIF